MQQVIRFNYPQQRDKFQKIQNLSHLQNLLKNCLPSCLNRCCFYLKCTNSDRHLYGKCRKCQATIRYRKESQGHYKLLTYNNHHVHHTKDKTQLIGAKHHLHSLVDAGWQYNQIVESIRDKFRSLSPNEVHFLMKNVKANDNCSSDVLLTKMKDLHQMVISEPSVGSTEEFKFIMITDEQKIKILPKHSKVIYLVIQTEDLINGRYFGGFGGYPYGLQFKCNAIFMMSSFTVDNIVGVIRSFIRTSQLKPRALITSQNMIFEQAINQMKLKGQFNGEHYLDYNSVLDNLQKKGLSHRRKYLLKQLAIEIDNYVFQDRLQGLIDQQSLQFGEDNQWLQHFIRYSDRFCYSQFRIDKIGLNRSLDHFTNSCRSILNRIHKLNDSHPLPSNIITLLSDLEAMQRRNHKQEKGLDQMFTKLKLFPVKFRLRPQLGINFMHLILKSLQLEGRKLNQSSYRVYQSWNINYYIVKKTKKIWQCECKFHNKCGLPCQHEIKVCLMHGDSVDRQIEERWMKRIEPRGNRIKGMASIRTKTIGDILPKE